MALGSAKMYLRLLDYDSEHVINAVNQKWEGDSRKIHDMKRRKQLGAAFTQLNMAANDEVE